VTATRPCPGRCWPGPGAAGNGARPRRVPVVPRPPLGLHLRPAGRRVGRPSPSRRRAAARPAAWWSGCARRAWRARSAGAPGAPAAPKCPFPNDLRSCYRSQHTRMVGVAMTVGADPAAVAAAVVGMAREGRFLEIEALFAPRLRAIVSAETLRVHWATEISRLGGITAVGQPTSEPGKAGLVRVTVPVTGEHGGLAVVMSVDDAGMLHGLRLAPPAATSWQPPDYANPKRLVEHEVTIGTGALSVPG